MIEKYLARIPMMLDAGHTSVSVDIEDLRKMATAIGKVEKKALDKGKIKLVRKGSVSQKLAGTKKKDRAVAGLAANRERARGKS